MIAVYVREENDLEGQFLGDEFEPIHLPQLVRSFKDFPTYLEDTGREAAGACGQYVHSEEKGVYFEIIVVAVSA